MGTAALHLPPLVDADAPTARPRVLCVDADERFLEDVRDVLHRRCEVLTTTSGFEAMRLAAEADVDVVLAGTDIPQLDGVRLLALVRRHAPQAARVLLATPDAGVDVLAAAVNEGGAHRILPRIPDREALLAAVDEGARRRRLRDAELRVLEHTADRVVSVLGELLAACERSAPRRAARTAELAAHAAAHLGQPVGWELVTAATLAPVGSLLAPGAATAAQLAAAGRLLAALPRFELVAALLDPADPPPLAALVLRGAVALEASNDPAATFARLREAGHPADVVHALAVADEATAVEHEVRCVALGELQTGMVVAEDVRRADGTLLIARGVTVGPVLAERLARVRLADTELPVLVRETHAG